MQNEKPQPNLSWPEGSDPHTHAIALLNRLFGKTDHAPVTIYIVENYIREELYGRHGVVSLIHDLADSVNSGSSGGKQIAPDPKNHFRISMLKSALRMIGYVVLVLDLRIGVGLLLISEFIGIVEELV